jgi:hypothetical protein
MKRFLVLIATLAALFMSAIPAGAVVKSTIAAGSAVKSTIAAGSAVKSTTWAYLAGSRHGSAVFMNGIITRKTSVGVVRSAGRLVYLQRNTGGVWHTMGSRISNVAGRLSAGFIQPRAYQYRLIVTGSSTALSARSAVTIVGALKPRSFGTVISYAYTTAYGWPDNSPPGNGISYPVIHSVAGGTGTYANPITLAVAHSLATGKDIPVYPAGTRFYMPNVRRYFIVEDACGDWPPRPTGSCANVKTQAPPGTSVWVDMWAGGNGADNAGVLACEDAVTGNYTIILNPDANRAVVPGPLYSGTRCTAQFGG